MNAIARFIKDTIVGGVLFMVPIIVLLAILGKAHGISMKIVQPLADAGFGTPRLLAVLFIVVFCFAAGLFARTKVARRLGDWLEGTILSKVPGYSLVKGIAESVAGTDRGLAQEVVLVRIEDAWQLAFLVERIEPGHVAVYIPGAPDPTSGAVMFLTEDRIRPLDVPVKTALERLRGVGKGSAAMLRGKL